MGIFSGEFDKILVFTVLMAALVYTVIAAHWMFEPPLVTLGHDLVLSSFTALGVLLRGSTNKRDPEEKKDA